MEQTDQQKKMYNAIQVLKKLSPDSTIPVIYIPIRDNYLIDNTDKWNKDLDTFMFLISIAYKGLEVPYDICPFPDDHFITLALSDIRNLLYQLMVLVNSEKI